MNRHDIVGQRFERLVVLADSGKRGRDGGVYWVCQCDCGKDALVAGSQLRGGRTRSCGCLAAEQSSIRGRARKKPPKKCAVPGCERTTEKGGKHYCGLHTQRLRRYGDPHYITPESVRRANSREAQLSRVESVKPTTYRKLFGRHEHRAVIEGVLGRKLRSDEVVHHKDGNKHNNDPKNLEIMSRSEHSRHHAPELQEARIKNNEWMRLRTEKPCGRCDEIKPLSEFYRHPRSPDGHGYTCKSCYRELKRAD